MINPRLWLYNLVLGLTGTGQWRAHYTQIARHAAPELASAYLRSTLDHAVTTVPFYRSLQVSPDRLDSFPILTRETLRHAFSALRSNTQVNGRSQVSRTGGSSGVPVTVLHDRSFRAWTFATRAMFYNSFLGSDYMCDRKLLLRGRGLRGSPIAELVSLGKNFLSRTTYIAELTVTSSTWARAIKKINASRPYVLIGYPTWLSELARFIISRNISVHCPHVIITTYETLYPTTRRRIEQAFSCRVHDFYGANEVGAIAGECDHGRLHIFSFNNHVEMLDAQDQPVGPGEEGRIVVTSLHNRVMPLIRYDIGDMARLSTKTCPCGSTLPLIEELTGRLMEHFMTPTGHAVYGGHFILLLDQCRWIRAFQILQEDVDRVVIFYSPSEGFPAHKPDMQRIDRAIHQVLGQGCVIHWACVATIPTTPLGKHLHSRSLLWEIEHPIERGTSRNPE